MQQVFKQKEQEQFEENSEENVQTVIETETDLTPQKVNLELAERTVTTTRTEKIVDGEEKTVIDMDESREVQEISYPRPDNLYQEKAEKIPKQTQEEKEAEEENIGKSTSVNFSRPKIVFLKVKAPEKDFPNEACQVPETADTEALRPSVASVIVQEEDSVGALIEEVVESPAVESETIEEEVERFLETQETLIEESGENYSSESYSEDEEEKFEPKMILEEPDIYEEIEDESYEVTETFFETLKPLEESLNPKFRVDSLEDFEGLKSYTSVTEGVVKAEYNPEENESGVSERVLVSMDALTEQESLEGSEVVEYLGRPEVELDATVAEIPYFSENSGQSWESGWNSFDMVLQMGDMDFQDTEYLISKPGETVDTPARSSIDSDFDSSKILEFRESQQWSNHDGGYEASKVTKNAWQEKYGEGIMELDSMERGIYAAIVEGNEFRGSSLDFSEMGLENGNFLEKVYRETTKREDYLEGFTPEAGGGGRATALS